MSSRVSDRACSNNNDYTATVCVCCSEHRVLDADDVADAGDCPSLSVSCAVNGVDSVRSRDTSPLKRSLTHDAGCDIPLKRAAMTHLLGTPTVGMISPRHIGVNSDTLPPTLFSCLPSLGNRQAPLAQRMLLTSSAHSCSIMTMSSTVTSTAAAAAAAAASTASSTLFSIPVHGVASSNIRPLLLIPSLHDCLLISSLGSTPLLYVLNANTQSRGTLAPPVMAAGISQPNIPQLSYLRQPVGRPAGADQVTSSANNTVGNFQPSLMNIRQRPVGVASVSGQLYSHTAAAVGIPHHIASSFSMPNIPVLSLPLQRVGGASSAHLSRATTACNVGIPHVSRTFMPLSLPLQNFPHPFQPVGGASISDQSRAPAVTSVGIPHIVRNSVPLRLPLSNIPLLSHVLRPVGGAAGHVDQSAVRLVSCVGGLRSTSAGKTHGRLNGLVTSAGPPVCASVSRVICLPPLTHIPSRHASGADVRLSTDSLLRTVLNEPTTTVKMSSSSSAAETETTPTMSRVDR